MKNLNKYPTPETAIISDNITIAINSDNLYQRQLHESEAIRLIKHLERRLAACRGSLDELDCLIASMEFSYYGEIRTFIRETLTATAKP